MVIAISHPVQHRQAASRSPERRATARRSAIEPLAWLATLARALRLRHTVVGSFEHVDGADLEDGGFRASDSMGLGMPLLRAFADTMPTYGWHPARHRSPPRAPRARTDPR